MNKDNIKTEIIVKEQRISVLRIDNKEFISLTDLARYANPDEPKIPIYAWMRNKDVLAYLGLWEQLNNENFKGHEFETFENEAGKNSFYMSPQKWIKETNAIGIISKSGNNSGTFAHADIGPKPSKTAHYIFEAEKVLEDKHSDLDDFGRLLDTTWRLKRQTGGAITTNSIDALYEKGIATGALGGKLLGAGGGGFLVFYVKSEKKKDVLKRS